MAVTQWLKDRKEYSTAVIRIGIALVLLWFGIDELRQPEVWSGYIPPWLAPIIPIEFTTFIIINGIVEIILGLLLLIGLYTRAFAFVAALHLLSIAVAVGYNDIAVRDLGLAAMALSLVFSGAGKWGVDGYIKNESN